MEVGNISIDSLSNLSSSEDATCSFSNWNSDCSFRFVLYRIVTPVLFCLITLTGTVGNFMVIFVISSRRTMRSLTNLMLLNLAVADVCFVLVCPPFTAAHFAFISWPFGDLACKLMHCATNVTVYVTVSTIILICVVRYTAIVHNSPTARFRTPRIIAVIILSLWVIMVCAAAPFAGVFGVVTRNQLTYCTVVDIPYGRRIFTVSCVFAYFLPVVIIGSLSIRLLSHIRKQRRSVVGGVPLRSTTASERSRQAACVIRLVVLAFVVLWLPINVDLLIFYHSCADDTRMCPQSRWREVFEVLARCLAYSNSCINPFIYNFVSKEFRHHFWDVVHCAKVHPRSASWSERSVYPRASASTSTRRLTSLSVGVPYMY